MSEPVVVVQGGVHASCVARLKRDLAACGYSPKDPNFMVTLFCDWKGQWDGTPFGLDFKSCSSPDFSETNIRCVKVHDPTRTRRWLADDLCTFYNAIDAADDARANGLKIISVCMKGKHRSKALQWALDPKDAHLPECVVMQAVARGWGNGRDMTLCPLGPARELRSKRARAA